MSFAKPAGTEWVKINSKVLGAKIMLSETGWCVDVVTRCNRRQRLNPSHPNFMFTAQVLNMNVVSRRRPAPYFISPHPNRWLLTHVVLEHTCIVKKLAACWQETLHAHSIRDNSDARYVAVSSRKPRHFWQMLYDFVLNAFWDADAAVRSNQRKLVVC